MQGTRQTPTDARTAAAVNGAQEKPENAHRRTEGSGNHTYIKVFPAPLDGCRTVEKYLYIYARHGENALEFTPRRDPGAVFHMWDTNKTPKTKTTRKSEKIFVFVLTFWQNRGIMNA